jgi:hypothetical protein
MCKNQKQVKSVFRNFIKTNMKAFTILTVSILICVACNQAQTVSVSEKNQVVSLRNNLVSVDFDLASGYYQVSDLKSKTVCIDSAFLQIDGWKSTGDFYRSYTESPETPVADGRSLLIESAGDQGVKLLLRFSLQPGKPYLILAAGVDNRSNDTLIIKKIMPLSEGRIFKGKNIKENLRILDGNGGGEPTVMRHRPPVACRNNMLLCFGNEIESHSLVMGGITYSEYNKAVRVDSISPAALSVGLYAEDFVGKRLDPNTVYLPEGDRFFLDCVTGDPFASLENYGKVLSEMQNAHPNYYYFPSICLWYAQYPIYGGVNTLATNDSPGAVEEMERVNRSGWLKYTTMAIRLVPDCYDENNENGWWDDEHWQMHDNGGMHEGMKLKGNHYREPYETTKKWAQAVTGLGGIPLIYFQTNIRSKDYVEKYPSHMLFNESYHKESRYEWPNNGYYTGYDFTDKDFSAHMRDVYKNLNDGGVRGLMYDYPVSGWAFFGGLDDKYSTAGGAYRRIFQFARDGLGNDSWLHERNLAIGSDITLNIVASQRIWGDTDIVTPKMVSRGGLRWYKNRVVVGYDMDAKNLIKSSPDNTDGLHKLLTMSYTAGSRLLLANSFSTLDQDKIFALSRIFPYHSSPLTARPVDMLLRDYPSIYSFRISDDWQQVVFYNQDDSAPVTLSAGLSDKSVRGGLELSANKSYYVYDFWNRRFIGKIGGKDKLTQELRPGEARMMSVRAVETHPQVLSTDRHLLQGYVELSDVEWDAAAKTLKGIAQLVEGEPMTIVVAANGLKRLNAKSEKGSAEIRENGDLLELVLKSETGGRVEWAIGFGI